jgi:pyridoxine kinase
MLLASGSGAWRVDTPELGFPTPPNGTGDLVSALFLAHLLRTRDPVEALELMTDSVFSVLERTRRDGTRELRLVQSKEALERPGRRFRAIRLGP